MDNSAPATSPGALPTEAFMALMKCAPIVVRLINKTATGNDVVVLASCFLDWLVEVEPGTQEGLAPIRDVIQVWRSYGPGGPFAPAPPAPITGRGGSPIG